MSKTPVIEKHDPYMRTESSIKEPPATFRGRLRYLGPGLILTAGIVGSGELIATTTLGAKAGMVALWVILVSCAVKVAMQLEFGKHAIHTGESTLAAFNKLPGPRFGKANWSIWTWLAIMLFKLPQAGGIVGGVALILNISFPGVGNAISDDKTTQLTFWSLIIIVVISLSVYRGYYSYIEKSAIWMIGLFTLFTFASLAFLQFTEYAISWPDVGGGLMFHLPREAVVYAVAAFGITGVGADEIMFYPYWCLEKGYAAHSGPALGTPEWTRRAKGWIRVMYVDALLAMVVYTVMTMAFYLLGASVLHGIGEIPEGYAMVDQLSRMYTETLGPWAKAVFLFGAFVVLGSTLFAGLAGWSRIFADAFGKVGLYDFYNPRQRARAIGWIAWILPMIWASLFLFFKDPVFMIILGGVSTSVILLLVVFAAFHFRYRRLPAALRPNLLYDIAFWLSAVAIILVGVYTVWKVIPKG